MTAATDVRLAIVGGHDTGHERAYGLAASRWAPESAPRPRVVALWCADPAAAAAIAAECGIERVAGSPAELVDRHAFDAILVLHKEPAEHLAMARPFLEAGLPTYVNKPVAYSLQDAEAMVQLAVRSGAPLLSCSALRYTPEVVRVQQRGEALGPWRAALAAGFRELLYYGVHAVEMVLSVLGPGVEWVQNLGHEHQDVLHLPYSDGRTADVLVLRDAVQVFHLAAFGGRGWARTEIGDTPPEHPMFDATIARILDMVRSGRPPVPYGETLEILRILLGAEQSRQRNGARVVLHAL